jgi:hypothetical protein
MVTPPPAPPHKGGEFPLSGGEGFGERSIKLINNLKIKDMKKINIIIQTVAVAGFLSLTSCLNELPFAQTPTDKTPPPPLTDVQVESIPGGAKIKYKLPDSDNDISYVKAEYINKGIKKTVRESVYGDSLLIEGLPSIDPVSVDIYVVDHSENVSTPKTISITPGTPLVETIFNSMNLVADFGGVTVNFPNPTATEIAVTVFSEDSQGILRERNTLFSKEINSKVLFRGFEPITNRFAVAIKDKWGNVSETKEEVLTPLFETQLDRLKFRSNFVAGDNTSVANNQVIERFWDGNTGLLWVTAYTDITWKFPQYITIDLGVIAKLNRYKLWGQSPYYYENFSFREWEVWGTDQLKPGMSDSYWKDGDWKNDWTKFDDYVLKRPSGSTSTAIPTGEDLAAAQAGWEFYIPLETPKCRFLRFVVNRVATPGASGMCMAEFAIWGDNTNN